ncbi:MAG: hypothetical protein ACRDNK_24900, partial [Solirubrobacteraceae bacterium]
LDALLGFGPAAIGAAERSPGIPCLFYHGEERTANTSQHVVFADHIALAPPLRRAQLTESRAAGFTPPSAAPADVVLATIDGCPAWVRRANEAGFHDHVAIAPDELATGEALRSRLAPERCLAVLSLAQFVRDLTGERRWQLPSTRAAFVIDDPNLRRPTYGHISYEELSGSAAVHNYHVSIAMVPLDARPAHPRAVALFRDRQEQISLCIHGNDHYGGELARMRSEDEGLAHVAQALRRVQSFERRTEIAVDRVMVPPHESMSRLAVAALLACGYEAFAGTRTFPWMTTSPDLSWLTRPTDADALTGWGSSMLMPGGFPLLVRMPFEHAREEVVLRAFLGQPVVLYGHHDVMEHGPGGLESAATAINRLGDIQWSSLAGIARGAVEWRRSGNVLQLRMLGRRVQFDVPSWAGEVVIDTTDLALPESARLLVRGCGIEKTTFGADTPARLPIARSGRLQLSLGAAVDAQLVPAPPRRLRPVARRLAAEARARHVAGRRRRRT